MEKVKAGLRGRTALEKVTLGRVVLEHMSANPMFPNPVPSLATLQAAVEELSEACVAALDRGRLACARKRRAVADLDKVLSALAAYVNSVGLGDPSTLLSSGFELAKRPAPINELSPPDGLSFQRTQFPDLLQVRWERVPGAVVYQLEVCYYVNGDQGPWERVALTTRPKARVQLHRQGPKPAFRVCAVGTQLQGPYCQTKMAEAA